MFEQIDPMQQGQSQSEPGQLPSQMPVSPQQSPVQPIPPASIHTMPDKFISGGSPKPSLGGGSSGGGGGKRLIIIVVVVAVVLGALTAGAYFYLNSPLSPFAPKSPAQPVANTPQQPSPSNETNQPPANANQTPPADGQSRVRDEQRMTDITLIAKALDAYFTKFGSYPQFLALLPADILPNPPKDPLTEAAYTYQANPDRTSYEIVFDVEEGVVFKGNTLSKGSYRLYPQDFSNANTNTSPIEPQPTEPGPVPDNLDADSDGLTTSEERLFKTSPNTPDTDSDGYSDQAEIMNFYSPIQTGAVTLEQAGLVKLYTNSESQYSFYYPSSWIVSALPESSEVLITSDTGEDFSIMVEANPDEKTAWEWYVDNVSGDFNKDNVNIVSVAGREAVRTLDGLHVYIADRNRVIVIQYQLNSVKTINYPTVFDLVLNRLTIQ